MKAKLHPSGGLAFLKSSIVGKRNYYQLKFWISIVLVLFVFQIFGQSFSSAQFSYISPKPGSKYIMPGNNIALRHGEKFDINSIRTSLIEVKNENNGKIGGDIILSDDSRTLIFLPEKPFELCSKVQVKLSAGLQTISGKLIEPIEFDFTITCTTFEINQSYIDKHFVEYDGTPLKAPNSFINKSKNTVDNNYPEGYANATILSDNSPHEGYYFYTPTSEWGWFLETLPFINIIDSYGIPIYYRKFQQKAFDLNRQPGGYLSCYSFEPYWGHILMDSSYNELDIYKMQNGYYYTDFHDFLLLENGNSCVMTYDPQLVDMSEIVSGGDPAAIVSGFVFQELDANKNVVFQWRSWDHYEITETGPEVDLTANAIDYVHGNTIEVESDTSFLISSRNFNEITKINRNTGEIIWRLGGSQNQFEFIGDTLGFSRQHDSRRNKDGHVTLFDNGHFHPEPTFSSAVEYDINPVAMTATLVNRYRHDPDNLGVAMGNAFWTPEESIVVGWGTSWFGITEFSDQGNSIFEIRFEGLSYRAYRYPWETNLFYPENDTLNMGYIWMEETKTKNIKIYNDQIEELVLTSYHKHTNNFVIENEFPITIPANDYITLTVTFDPNEAGTFEDVLTINSDINTEELVQRIAQQIKVIGHASAEQSIQDQWGNKFVVSPNPASDYTNISFEKAVSNTTISLYNITGKKIIDLHYNQVTNCVIDVSNLKKGMYFIQVQSDELNSVNTIKFVKK